MKNAIYLTINLDHLTLFATEIGSRQNQDTSFVSMWIFECNRASKSPSCWPSHSSLFSSREERHQLTNMTLIHIEMRNVQRVSRDSITLESHIAPEKQPSVIGTECCKRSKTWDAICRLLFRCMNTWTPTKTAVINGPFFDIITAGREKNRKERQLMLIVWIRNMMICSNNWSNETIKNARNHSVSSTLRQLHFSYITASSNMNVCTNRNTIYC